MNTSIEETLNQRANLPLGVLDRVISLMQCADKNVLLYADALATNLDPRIDIPCGLIITS